VRQRVIAVALEPKSQLHAKWRKAMPGLEDMIRSSVPGGNIGKPLMIALAALLASGALFRGGSQGQTSGAGRNRHPTTAAPVADCSADWAGC
jgi:hypothetical protein